MLLNKKIFLADLIWKPWKVLREDFFSLIQMTLLQDFISSLSVINNLVLCSGSQMFLWSMKQKHLRFRMSENGRSGVSEDGGVKLRRNREMFQPSTQKILWLTDKYGHNQDPASGYLLCIWYFLAAALEVVTNQIS